MTWAIPPPTWLSWKAISISCWVAVPAATSATNWRSEEHTSELQSRGHLVCRLLLVRPHPWSSLFPYTTLFRSLVIVGGFLGSGKTTLLNLALQRPGVKLLINDLGDTAPDLAFMEGNIHLLLGGCACCDKRDELEIGRAHV